MNIWMRVGVTLNVPDEMADKILRPVDYDEAKKLLEDVFRGKAGSWVINGDAYIPDEVRYELLADCGDLENEIQDELNFDFGYIEPNCMKNNMGKHPPNTKPPRAHER